MKKSPQLFILIFLLSVSLADCFAQKNSLLHYVSAKEYLKIDSLNLALVELDSAISIAPNFEKNYALKAKVFKKKNENRRAIGQYSLAILHNPYEINYYLNRASLHFKLKDHRDYLLNDVNKAIQIEPLNGDLYELKAFYYAHTLNPKSLKPDYQNAIIAMNKSILINPVNARYYKNRSDYKIKNKQQLSSLLDINKAIEIEGGNASYYHQRAVIRFIMGDFRSSLNDINESIEIDGNSIDFYQFRGNVYYNLKRYDQAYNDYSIAINLIFNKIGLTNSKLTSSSKLNLKLRQILLLRGMSLVHGNKPFDGCNDFNRALKMGESKAKNYINQYCN